MWVGDGRVMSGGGGIRVVWGLLREEEEEEEEKEEIREREEKRGKYNRTENGHSIIIGDSLWSLRTALELA